MVHGSGSGVLVVLVLATGNWQVMAPVPVPAGGSGPGPGPGSGSGRRAGRRGGKGDARRKTSRRKTHHLVWTSGCFCGHHMRSDKTETKFCGQRIWLALTDININEGRRAGGRASRECRITNKQHLYVE
jgi:hypothetical protein